MSSFITGEPAAAEAVLPAAKLIASTTHATPIVVTTSSPHGLAPGDYFAVYGATDPNANFLWMAGTCTPTTVVLLQRSSGANSVGTLVGGTVGTLAPAGFGETFQIPNDLTDLRSAASVNVAFEALADRTAWLLFAASYFINLKAGGTMFVRALSNVLAEAGSTFSGVFDFVSTSIVKMRGRRALAAPNPIAAGNVTIDVTQGAIRTITAAGAAASTIVLDSTTHVPEDGEIIDVHWRVDANNESVVMTFTRDAGHASTPICSMNPSAVLDNYMLHARFQCYAGVWRLGPASLRVDDGTVEYGVHALAGAA